METQPKQSALAKLQWLVVAVIVVSVFSWSIYSLVDQFLGSDLQEQYLSWVAPVPLTPAVSIQDIATRACPRKPTAIVVHYFRSDDSNFAEQNKVLEVLNRHFGNQPVSMFEVNLDKMAATAKPHQDPSVDIIGLIWNDDRSGIIEGFGPQTSGFSQYPQAYFGLRSEISHLIERGQPVGNSKTTDSFSMARCAELVSDMLMMPALAHDVVPAAGQSASTPADSSGKSNKMEKP